LCAVAVVALGASVAVKNFFTCGAESQIMSKTAVYREKQI